MDRLRDDVCVDRLFTNLSGRASHDRRHRGFCSGVDLDPDGEVCGDAVGAEEETKGFVHKKHIDALCLFVPLWLSVS